MQQLRCLAIDLGADSGRVILGMTGEDGIRQEVLHRFPNQPRRGADGHLRWDLESLWDGIREGLRLGAARGPIASIAVDTWGVDYGLVDAQGHLLAAPFHYRDARTEGIAAEIEGRFGKAALFARTGTRSLPFNTIFQLVAHQRAAPEQVAQAHRLLTIPDLLAFRLSGVMANEWTNAGTTGLTRAGQMAWDRELIQDLGLPGHLFGPIVRPGSILGPMLPDLAQNLGFTGAVPRIIAPGAHDTASAIAAMPVADAGTAYISCGTWSLMGVLRDQPLTTPMALAADLSNEVSVDGRVRLLRNIMGLWVWQECRRDRLAEGLDADHGALAALAAAAAPGPVTLAQGAIDLNHLDFLAPSTPGDRMLDRLRRHAAARGLNTTDDGAVFRRITEALAAAYAACRTGLEEATGTPITRICLLGGGVRNRLLCELTGQACSLPVLIGSEEATALGNLLVQVRALGEMPVRATQVTV